MLHLGRRQLLERCERVIRCAHLVTVEHRLGLDGMHTLTDVGGVDALAYARIDQLAGERQATTATCTRVRSASISYASQSAAWCQGSLALT